jgi:aspartyl/asparaginyl beta-hydroxylase (cupin superfamily)
LPSGTQAGSAFTELVGSLNWTALDLFIDGHANTALTPFFPETLAALAQAPLYGLEERPFEVFFSLLRPGQHIKPHYGLSNHSLTVHLPLVIPKESWLRVGGEKRRWKQGELTVFDDTFLHEACNESEDERIVLIFSIWHPELSEAERDAIRRSFRARQRWLAMRRLPNADDLR